MAADKSAAVIAQTTGDVVWQWSKGLDHQHEAVMVERGALGAGLVMVFIF